MGIEELHGERVFVLKFLQARVPSWSRRVFFAAFDPQATWFDELKPAFGAPEFFFEKQYDRVVVQRRKRSSGQMCFDESSEALDFVGKSAEGNILGSNANGGPMTGRVNVRDGLLHCHNLR